MKREKKIYIIFFFGFFFEAGGWFYFFLDEFFVEFLESLGLNKVLCLGSCTKSFFFFEKLCY